MEAIPRLDLPYYPSVPSKTSRPTNGAKSPAMDTSISENGGPEVDNGTTESKDEDESKFPL